MDHVDGSAGEGSTSAAAPGESHFEPGQVQAPIVVPLLADFEVEGDEVFSIELTGADGATISEPSTVQVTIQDDDIEPEISIETLTPTFLGRRGQCRGGVGSSRSHPTTGWKWSGSPPVGRRLTASTTSGVTISGKSNPAGPVTISIPILEDTKIEDDETFFVDIDVVYGESRRPMMVMTITDNDVLPEIHLTEMAVAADESRPPSS